MTESIVVALIAFAGTMGGTIGGIVISSRLTNYRIQQLEEKVNKHNNLIDRMYKVESRCSILEDLKG